MIQALVLYFQFFTQIPIGYQVEEPAEYFKKGIGIFFVFAFIYGGLLSLVYFLLDTILSKELAWTLILVVDVLLTKGFHYDALADTLDGLMSSRPKEECLRIMKDPNIGPMGTLGLILYFLISYQLGKELLMTTDIKPFLLPFLWASSGRGLLVISFHRLHYAGLNPQGLGSVFEGVADGAIWINQLVMMIVLSLITWQWALAYISALISMFVYRHWVYQKIQGMTGDTMGASVLIGQTIFLLLGIIVFG